MSTFQNVEDVNTYYEKQLDQLELAYEQKQQMIKKNEQQIRATLQVQFKEQLETLEQQKNDEEQTLKTNRDKAILRIQTLFQHKKEAALEKYEENISEQFKEYQVSKMELLEQQQIEERAKLKAYHQAQKAILFNMEQTAPFTVEFEQQLDELQMALKVIFMKYEAQYEQLHEQYEETCEQLEEQRDEAIEKLEDSEAASQAQLDDQLFEALQDLEEKIDAQQTTLENSFIDKEASIEDMVRTQYEKMEAQYEQQRHELFEQLEQALSEFD